MNKKGIVLVVTLFFITAISVLVLKNLDDTDKYIKKSEYTTNMNQVLISIKNTKDEISKLLKGNKKFVDEYLDLEGFSAKIPLSQKELDISFSFYPYEKVNINLIKDDPKSTLLRERFDEFGVYDYDYFVDSYKEITNRYGKDKKVETNKQLSDIIDNFILKTDNKDIQRLKKELGFIEDSKMYELDIDVNYYDTRAKAYYILDDKGKVKYFDIGFN